MANSPEVHVSIDDLNKSTVIATPGLSEMPYSEWKKKVPFPDGRYHDPAHCVVRLPNGTLHSLTFASLGFDSKISRDALDLVKSRTALQSV